MTRARDWKDGPVDLVALIADSGGAMSATERLVEAAHGRPADIRRAAPG